MYQYLENTTGKEVARPRQKISPRGQSRLGRVHGKYRKTHTIQQVKTLVNAFSKNISKPVFENSKNISTNVLYGNYLMSVIAKAATDGPTKLAENIRDAKIILNEAERENISNLNLAKILIPEIRENLKNTAVNTVEEMTQDKLERLKNMFK
ncbi:hypothetical protein JF50_00910 [Pseudoalteromonas luteoviolacea]|uniref:Uncharacterized protein n=1 Tax=Pseudoalteromonas luteoviolacea TaxID=43657 RepID=A0A0C1QVG0_9GAMM|nr:hypothetical protein [Pseudoalteromonas luteoviolacea]KID59047.1 hypothetical protein JF50_00910 [Pseudoalteromonas luteoviolacea]